MNKSNIYSTSLFFFQYTRQTKGYAACSRTRISDILSSGRYPPGKKSHKNRSTSSVAIACDDISVLSRYLEGNLQDTMKSLLQTLQSNNIRSLNVCLDSRRLVHRRIDQSQAGERGQHPHMANLDR